ncbi:glycosyltransferase family 2 protein [Desulfobacca acetoxidans]|uniref:Glycosyl transferase family 2 n=1 Tax=Desulfobacca acetoxidans (strain ATCC 700848 / DSM 11109 / ASRB2) TaxID=880072 RepID=F2NH45_DESAR|nr:glycosyltransferase family 2 protein [Desulfobacca acetoxidans]AEB08816.1 glycosyl transferase family 2 [Desulfobacca acetoxidans DSM 11109]
MKSRLSVTVITHNEEANIVDCLESASWANEIVVLDSDSTDRTVLWAKQFTDRVYSVPWHGFGKNKNQAIDEARMEWIFVLDADERITPALRREIQEILKGDGPADGYRVPRRNHFCGRFIRHLGWYPDYSIRLFRKANGRFIEREVHESVEINGSVGTLREPMLHYTYRTISDFVLRMDRYSTLAAQELLKQDKKPHFGELVWRPFFTFLSLYALKKGFLEGRAGYTLAFLYSTYNFLKYYKFRELHEQRAKDGGQPLED